METPNSIIVEVDEALATKSGDFLGFLLDEIDVTIQDAKPDVVSEILKGPIIRVVITSEKENLVG